MVSNLGKRLIECILEAKKWPKSIPRITEEAIAIQVADILLRENFFHRSEKVKDKKGYLKVIIYFCSYFLNLI
jgi:hypothetical protein